MYFALVAVVTLLASPSAGQERLHAIRMRVGAGNYSYFTLNDKGPVVIVLTSLSGDADLYVSDSLQQPTFDFDMHFSSSASCGIDEIELDSRTKRPIYIGVYGHPRYEISEFLIEAYSGPQEYDPFDVDEIVEDGAKPEHKKSNQRREQTSDFHDGRNGSLARFLGDLVWSILQILLEILL